MIEIIVLSVVQGITEFIPVSSSLHLLIFGELLTSINYDSGLKSSSSDFTKKKI